MTKTTAIMGNDIITTFQGEDPQGDIGEGGLAASLAEIALNVKSPQFGAKGDGITDDTAAIQSALNYQNGATIYFPDGTYLISSPLTVNNDSNLLLSNGATIKANASMDYVIKYNTIVRTSASDQWTQHKYIKGGQLDGNFLATNVLGLDYYMGFILEDIKILNCTGYGLRTNLTNSTYTHELKANNLYFRNTQSKAGSMAIYNNGKDNIFTNIIIRDFQIGIWTIDGLFSKVHGWIGFPDIVGGSYFIITEDAYAIIDQCYADTYQYSFTSRFGSMRVSNSIVLYNNNIYTSSLATTYPIQVFRQEASTIYGSGNGTFNAQGNVIHSYLNITLVGVKNSANVFSANTIIAHSGATIDQTNYTDSFTTSLNNIINGTYTNVQSVFANVSAYGSFRAFIPLVNASQKTITLSSASYMTSSATTDVTSSCTVGAKFQNGFIVQCTSASVAGSTGLFSYTVA